MTIFSIDPFLNLLANSMRRRFESDALIGLTISTVVIAMAAAALLSAWRRAKGATLRAPLVWAMISLVSLVVIEAVQLRDRPRDIVQTKWLFIAATSTLCPIMAMLGAKRPQNRAWPWIVASLWFIAALPAIESLIIHPTERLELHPLWWWFLGSLIFIGCVNFIPTRFGPSVLLAAIAQIFLLLWPIIDRQQIANFVGAKVSSGALFLSPGDVVALNLINVSLLAMSICWAYFLGRESLHKRTISSRTWDQMWRDFRNAYGIVWSVRVMQRFNSLAESSHAPARLDWSGFYHLALGYDAAEKLSETNQSNPAADRRAGSLDGMESTLLNLLRRFVSDAWVEARLPSGNGAPIVS